jgi:SAM-dependent methyltransferase
VAIDVIELRDFYASPLGQVARRMIRRQIRALWPDVRGFDVLGLGYAIPYLRPFREEAQRTIALMPATQGVTRWPEEGKGLVCLGEETELPFANAGFERVLLVHALEHSESVRQALREIWRVLAPEGKLLIVLPHRRGLWAGSERTPFGQGHPYSRAQITRLLNDCLFAPGAREAALHFPPLYRRALLRSAGWWEDVGRVFWPGLSGVILVEATKRVFAVTPKPVRRRRLAPVPAPAYAPLR